MHTKSIRSRRIVALVVVTAGAVLAASAVATATIPDSGGVIHGLQEEQRRPQGDRRRSR
jgi:hypothetical protein